MEKNPRNLGQQDVSIQLLNLRQSAQKGDQSASTRMTLDFDKGAQESSYDVSKSILERVDTDRSTLSSRKVLVDSQNAAKFGVSFERGFRISNDTTAAISLVHNTFQAPYYTWSHRTTSSRNTRAEAHAIYTTSGSLLSFDIEIPDRVKNLEYPSKYDADSIELRVATLASLIISDEEILLESNTPTQSIYPNKFMAVKNASKFIIHKFASVPEFTALPEDAKTKMYDLALAALNSRLNQKNVKDYLKNEIYSVSSNESANELILKGSLDSIIEKYCALPLKLTFTPVNKEDAFDVSVTGSKDVNGYLAKPFRMGTGESITIYNISYAINKKGKINLEVDIHNNPKENKIIQITPQLDTAVIDEFARTTDRERWQVIFRYKAISYSEDLLR